MARCCKMVSASEASPLERLIWFRIISKSASNLTRKPLKSLTEALLLIKKIILYLIISDNYGFQITQLNFWFSKTY